MRSSPIPKLLLAVLPALGLLVLGIAGGFTDDAFAQPTPACADQWPVATVHTIGKGQSPDQNPKVSHAITGNIIDPSSVTYTDDRIRVCSGTSVKITVTDATGTPTVTASTPGISCTDSGCTAEAVIELQQYVSHSSDGADTDRISLVPE